MSFAFFFTLNRAANHSVIFWWLCLQGAVSLSCITLLTKLPSLIARMLACGCGLSSDAPPISGDEAMWKLLWWLHYNVFKSVSVPPREVMCFSVFPRMFNKLLCSVFSGSNLVITSTLTTFLSNVLRVFPSVASACRAAAGCLVRWRHHWSLELCSYAVQVRRCSRS